MHTNSQVQALTLSEERFRCSYSISYPGEACQLNQNPDTGFGAVSRSGRLPTIIGNCHMLWSDRARPRRWMMGTEALCTQAFPVTPQLFELGAGELPVLCSFNLPRAGRNARCMLTQAGNSMNVLVMSVILLHGLTQWERKLPSPLLYGVRDARAMVRAKRSWLRG